MPDDTKHSGSSSLLGSITRILDASFDAGAGFENIITVLSLLCLLSITNRNNPAGEVKQPQQTASTNPLHKLLGDLTKGSDNGGGISSDTLLSLLPLLNNPQLKSKLNPNTIGTVMGLINNLGGFGGGSTATEKAKPEAKTEPSVETSTQPKPPQESEAMHQTTNSEQLAQTNNSSPLQSNENMEEVESKNYGRYLNWKNNF